MKKHFFFIRLSLALATLVLIVQSAAPVLAVTTEEFECSQNNCPFFSTESGICSASTTIGAGGASDTSTDQYMERVVQERDRIAKLTRQLGLYKQIGDKADIPWQFLAAIHYREHSNKTSNSNHTFTRNGVTVSEGAWGFYGNNVDRALAEGIDLTPNKELNDAEFIKQGELAAKIIREKAGSRSTKLTKTANTFDIIGYTAFGYNGRANAYIQQALRLGFSQADAENGAGSPYVTNFLTDKQSPSNPSWQQFLSDGGDFGPANQQVGIWPLFAALGGITIAADCSGSTAPVGSIQRVLDLANSIPAGITINQAKQLGYVTNSYPSSAPWCAIFATGVYKKAGVEIPGGKWGPGLYSWAADPVRLTKAYPDQFILLNPWKGQKAAPGDFIIWATDQINSSAEWDRYYEHIINTPLGADGQPNEWGIQHVGIVTAVTGDKVTTLEGNTRYPVPNGVTSKNTYTVAPGKATGWQAQIFGFVRKVK